MINGLIKIPLPLQMYISINQTREHFNYKQADKLKGREIKDECRMLKDEGGVEDERTDRWMDICDYSHFRD